MTKKLLDPYELGGPSLELDVQESDFPADFWAFQRLAEHQNMQFSDTIPHAFVTTAQPLVRRRARYPETPAKQTPGVQRKFRATPIGNPGMDFEHEQLMLQLERVCGAADLLVALGEIDKFIKAWDLHHLHEEQHMKAKGYPDLAAHIAQHARLADRYQFVRNETMQGEVELDAVKGYVEIVATLMADHILRSDMLYARWADC
jgi:hemerythrin-like metal-binding protein